MLEFSPAMTYTFLLILIRTSGMLVSAPLLSHRGIPPQAKVGFAVVFSLVLVPVFAERLPEPPQHLGDLASAVLREALFGLALGLAMNMVFLGLQMAAKLIGVQIGYGLGGVFDPITGADSGVMDQFYLVLVTLVFFAINGHHLMVQTLAETLYAVPPGTFDPMQFRSAAVAAVGAGLLVTAVRIAMPVMAALMLTDLGMGLVARTVPQVHVIIVGLPIKIAVGMVVIIAALPATVHVISVVLQNSFAGTSEQLLGVR